MTEYDVEAKVEELKSPAKFDLKAALSKATSPTEDVQVFIDGADTHKLNVLLDRIAEVERDHASERAAENSNLAALQAKIAELTAGANGGIVDDPDLEPTEAKLAEAEAAVKLATDARARVLEGLNAQTEALLTIIRSTALTFTLRGIEPSVWRLIDAKWRRHKSTRDVVRDSYTDAEEWQADQLERQILRNKNINIETVQKAIVKVTNAEGAVDDSGFAFENMEELYGTLYESQWKKLEDMAANLTFAHTLFNQVVEQDADFLPKR